MGVSRALVLALALLLGTVSAGLAAPDDVLVIGVASDIHLLDPGVSSANSDWRQIYPCYDRLVRYKVVDGLGSTEVEASAAESWSVSADGLVWTFNLRSGVRFDDGRALDAEAARFSFERALKIGKGPADNLSPIRSVEVLGPLTLRVTLKHPFGPFLQTLATDGASIVNPNVMTHEVDGDLAQGWLAEHVDGSGPYRVREWIRGQRCVLEARPDYWGEAPRFRTVIIRFMSESADRRMALERGDIDVAEQILLDQIPALEKNPDIAVRKYPSQLVEYVYLNCRRPPLDNPKVRQAISHAVDYQGVIDYVLGGEGVQMRGPLPEGMWGHDPGAFQYARDPARARALLAEAGVQDLALTLTYSERRPTWEQIATILQSNLAEVGIRLRLEMVANPTLRDRLDKGDFELSLGVWSPDFADPYMFMNFWFDSALGGLPGNRAFYANPRVDELVRAAAATPERAERVRLYKEAQAIVIDEAPYVYLYNIKTIAPMRADLRGYVHNPMLESMYNFEGMWRAK